MKSARGTIAILTTLRCKDTQHAFGFALTLRECNDCLTLMIECIQRDAYKAGVEAAAHHIDSCGHDKGWGHQNIAILADEIRALPSKVLL